MSVDPTLAEKALAFLTDTGEDVLPLARQERLKAHMLKHIEGLLVKGMSNQGIPATLQEKYARADDRWHEAAKEDAEAWGEWISLKERRDTARIAISLYQSQVKDRG
jgi:hypothetical protein